MEEIARAVQAASYNDAVVVEVEGREIVLVATIDQSAGGCCLARCGSSGCGDWRQGLLGCRHHPTFEDEAVDLAHA